MNLFLHSLFSQVDISLNEQLISASTNTYPYRAMIEALLNYGEEAKTSKLSTAMFYKDTALKLAPAAQDTRQNTFLARFSLFHKVSSRVKNHHFPKFAIFR